MPAIPLTPPPRSHLPRLPATAIVLALVASRPLVLILIVAGHFSAPHGSRDQRPSRFFARDLSSSPCDCSHLAASTSPPVAALMIPRTLAKEYCDGSGLPRLRPLVLGSDSSYFTASMSPALARASMADNTDFARRFRRDTTTSSSVSGSAVYAERVRRLAGQGGRRGRRPLGRHRAGAPASMRLLRRHGGQRGGRDDASETVRMPRRWMAFPTASELAPQFTRALGNPPRAKAPIGADRANANGLGAPARRARSAIRGR